MGEARDLTLSPDDVQLALATADAMKSAGGQVAVEAMTGRAQSRLSDYCSRNTASFIPLNLAARVDELRIDAQREPYILRAYANRLGFTLMPKVEAPAGMGEWFEAVVRLSGDVGTVAQTIQAAVADGRVEGCEPGRIRASVREAMAALSAIDALAEAAEKQ